MLESSEKTEKKEELALSKSNNFENIKNQVIDRLLDDIDISKVSKYPDLNEFVSKYAESPEKLEEDIDGLSDSSKLLDKEDRNILETIKEKAKKPLAIVCLLGVLMTGSGAIEDQNRDSKLTQFANNLGINNVAHAQEEVDWDSMMVEAQEGLEEDKEENEELKEENEKLEQRLEMLKKINKQLDKEEEDWSEKEEDWSEKEEKLEQNIEETNKEFRNHIETFAEDIDSINDDKKQWSIEVLEKFDIFEDEEKTQDYLELFKNN